MRFAITASNTAARRTSYHLRNCRHKGLLSICMEGIPDISSYLLVLQKHLVDKEFAASRSDAGFSKFPSSEGKAPCKHLFVADEGPMLVCKEERAAAEQAHLPPVWFARERNGRVIRQSALVMDRFSPQK
eukprot:1148234-Pelagomonas_calceolata.AAC.6